MRRKHARSVERCAQSTLKAVRKAGEDGITAQAIADKTDRPLHLVQDDLRVAGRNGQARCVGEKWYKPSKPDRFGSTATVSLH